MFLIPVQKKLLLNYQGYLKNPPTFWSLVNTHAPRIGISIALCSVLIWASTYFPHLNWLQLVAGIILFSQLTALIIFRASAKLWPVMKEIINWNRVEEILKHK